MKSMYVTLLGMFFITSCNQPGKAVLSDSTVPASKMTASFVPLHSVYEPQVESCGCDHDTASCAQTANSEGFEKPDCANSKLVSAKCGSEDMYQKMLQLKK
ncbi:MAG: hypothetical protein HY062_18140 [Bacteroidetes bacterium]|nr:hypothetical protein [Bacteroidota bacterium]